MSEKLVAVPQSQLDKVERARKDLFQFAEELGWDKNQTWLMTRLMNITGPLWEVANRKYPEVLDKIS
jgi:predicted nucleotidyltransferase